jgi:hypothetical protein
VKLKTSGECRGQPGHEVEEIRVEEDTSRVCDHQEHVEQDFAHAERKSVMVHMTDF